MDGDAAVQRLPGSLDGTDPVRNPRIEDGKPIEARLDQLDEGSQLEIASVVGAPEIERVLASKTVSPPVNVRSSQFVRENTYAHGP